MSFVNRVRRCLVCSRWNHSAFACRGVTTCSRCDEAHKTEGCYSISVKCTNCKGSHHAFDTSCPVFNYFMTINTIMSYCNTDRRHAVKLMKAKGITSPLMAQNAFKSAAFKGWSFNGSTLLSHKPKVCTVSQNSAAASRNKPIISNNPIRQDIKISRNNPKRLRINSDPTIRSHNSYDSLTNINKKIIVSNKDPPSNLNLNPGLDNVYQNKNLYRDTQFSNISESVSSLGGMSIINRNDLSFNLQENFQEIRRQPCSRQQEPTLHRSETSESTWRGWTRRQSKRRHRSRRRHRGRHQRRGQRRRPTRTY
ncbi:uncharacterized protein LOC118645840 [Monomorium pharaonis]|uniref:uncharacterized protein LOC118645840 n=1 Tax=Monomorium pharaonis TaxID=307658 RepID=UPI001747A81B|nr:uncharacterized protein LOC118645840 [Monomorium pharaonis]